MCKVKEKHRLFLEHIVKVTKFVQQRYPQVTTIMWDDMLRVIDANLLKGKTKYILPNRINYMNST